MSATAKKSLGQGQTDRIPWRRYDIKRTVPGGEGQSSAMRSNNWKQKRNHIG